MLCDRGSGLQNTIYILNQRHYPALGLDGRKSCVWEPRHGKNSEVAPSPSDQLGRFVLPIPGGAAGSEALVPGVGDGVCQGSQ